VGRSGPGQSDLHKHFVIASEASNYSLKGKTQTTNKNKLYARFDGNLARKEWLQIRSKSHVLMDTILCIMNGVGYSCMNLKGGLDSSRNGGVSEQPVYATGQIIT
jgi:hypothetical protein